MNEIVKDDIILARHIKESDIKPGLNFFSRNEEFIQAGLWEYEEGKELLAHIHNKVERTVDRTYEVLYIIKGCISADIYDLEGIKIDEIKVCQGDILILLECGHGYHILEKDTKVLEIKNGPYLGADIDRYRL